MDRRGGLHSFASRAWGVAEGAGRGDGDIEAVLALMHSDVSWPNGLEGGRLRGRDEVWSRQWGRIDSRVEPIRFEDDTLGRTVVQVHQVVRDRTGHILADEIVEHVYAIHAGLIERMDIRRPETGPAHEPPPGSVQ